MITCSSVGVWSSWSSWHNTAPVDQYGLYFQSRQRTCQKNPPDCTTETKHLCNAVHAEVRLCVLNETYPAQCSDERPVEDFQLRHEDVVKKPLEKHHQIIPSIKKIRTKRQLNFCRACVNLVGTTSNLKHDNGADGQLVIVYGIDSGGCRTADVICYSESTNQDAIIYANGNKNNPLAISPTGTIHLNLFCDRNSHWTIPNLQTNIRHVTCLLRDNLQPMPTRPPLPTTPKPCSTCPNVITAKVKNPALGEADGVLSIQYEKDDNGCRVAKLVCSTNYEFAEAIIYLNGMKNSPVARSKNGTVMFSLLCSSNLRFRLLDSRDFIANVTCLSREFTPPTMAITTVRTTTTRGPPLCSKCRNIKTLKIANLKANERNGQLKIEYSKQDDGCRLANVVCGDGEIQTTARIFVNGENDLPLISDITGEVEIELACGSDIKWKAFQATAIIESVSCLIIDVSRTTTMEPITTSAKPIVPECEAQWTEWISWSSCTDSCGAFGSRKRFRSCERNHDDCFCIGSISDSEFCNIQPCLYPRTSCRKDYVVSTVDQKFACVPNYHISE